MFEEKGLEIFKAHMAYQIGERNAAPHIDPPQRIFIEPGMQFIQDGKPEYQYRPVYDVHAVRDLSGVSQETVGCNGIDQPASL